MITTEEILRVSKRQTADIAAQTGRGFVSRAFDAQLLSPVPEFARIITGIRRCGKSTLVSAFLFSRERDAFYLNFDDPALYGFTGGDFAILSDAVLRWQEGHGGARNLYFDEIQTVAGWEVFVSSLLRGGNLVTVTGSNASLLSYELGTRLTGRHLDWELFPFSFTEFCLQQNCAADSAAAAEYIAKGGFPEFLLYGRTEILRRLFDDILMRDIVIRHGIKDVRSVQTLALYLASNCGNLVTGTKLSAQLGLKTAATILEYLSFFEQSYLFFLVPKFDHSARAQSINPKKVYCIDTGMVAAVTLSAGGDRGRMLENAVFVELRRRTKNIWYYAEAAFECDFLYGEGAAPQHAVQVCWELSAENREREVRGLVETCKKFPGVRPLVVTLGQRDTLSYGGMTVEAIPAAEFFTGSKLNAGFPAE